MWKFVDGAKTRRRALRRALVVIAAEQPASLTTLEQAVKRAHSAYEKAERAQREHQRAAPDGDPQAA